MGDRKYKAFISYSHADEMWGGWLQRALENFRAPKGLAAAIEARGASASLSPVFRDREDLPVAGDLNAAIKAALSDSEFQIVLCSPNSARSKWVNEEIKLFHRLHGPGRVFAIIVAGEPHASRIPGREQDECFPPALLRRLDDNGEMTDDPAEPLAADARDGGDGKRYAMLKVAAGMLGVGLDDLVQRDASRRARQAWQIAAASVGGALAAVALAVFAFAKSNEATRARLQAENLVEFMLTNLTDRLEPVGKLDILESVGDRAMTYYEGQDLKSLDDAALTRRAKAMRLLGRIYAGRNEIAAARKLFDTAEATTADLLGHSPDDPDLVFEHAQNVFYVGDSAFKLGDPEKGAARYEEYLLLAERLMALDGDNSRSQLELAYATSNIGILKFNQRDYAGAIPQFEASIAVRKKLLEAAPAKASIRIDYAYAISWKAFAELQIGAYREAIASITEQLAAYGDLADIRTGNFTALDAVVTAHRRLAEAHLQLGDVDAARTANNAAETIADALLQRDDSNANWRINAAQIQRMKSYLLALSGDRPVAERAADRSVSLVEQVLTDDAPAHFYTALGQALAWRIELFGSHAAEADAARLDSLVADAAAKRGTENLRLVAAGSLRLARYLRDKGKTEAADAAIARGIAALEPLSASLPASSKAYLAALHIAANAPQKAAPLIEELDAIGVASPEFMRLKGQYSQAALE